MAQADVDSWNAGLRSVLIARVTNTKDATEIAADLDTMDTDWAAMTSEEKTPLVARMAQCNAAGARTRITLADEETPYFPKAIIVKAALYDDLVTRYTNP